MKNEKAENVFDTTPQDSSKDKAPNVADSQAAGFADDLGGFQGASAGIYLSGNEQARAAESTKSAAKPTLKPVAFVLTLIVVVSVAKNVDLWLKYNRLQDVYIDTLARHTGWERSYILEAMKYSLDKVKPNIKEQRESGQIDLFPYKERSLNKEFENLNKEIEKDIGHKLDKIELGGGVNE